MKLWAVNSVLHHSIKDLCAYHAIRKHLLVLLDFLEAGLYWVNFSSLIKRTINLLSSNALLNGVILLMFLNNMIF